MYSALKVNGKKLYELAREGKVIERKARPVKILDIQILEIDLPKVRMEVLCSKGTYIRTLCHDIGEKLGCGGCMESLIRTRVSTFRIEDAKTLDEIETLKQEGKLAELLVPIDAMFPSYPKITVRHADKTKKLRCVCMMNQVNSSPFTSGKKKNTTSSRCFLTSKRGRKDYAVYQRACGI